MAELKTPYKILEIPIESTEEEIRHAYAQHLWTMTIMLGLDGKGFLDEPMLVLVDRVAKHELDQLLRHTELEGALIAAQAAESAKDWGQASAAYSELLSSLPDNGELLDRVGMGQANDGDLDGARTTYDSLVASKPNSAVYWSHFAGVLEKAGEVEQAEDALKKAAACGPKEPSYFLNLGRHRRSRKQFSEAEGLIDIAVKAGELMGWQAIDPLFEYLVLHILAREPGKLEADAERIRPHVPTDDDGRAASFCAAHFYRLAQEVETVGGDQDARELIRLGKTFAAPTGAMVGWVASMEASGQAPKAKGIGCRGRGAVGLCVGIELSFRFWAGVGPRASRVGDGYALRVSFD